jgi:hypothetical protein
VPGFIRRFSFYPPVETITQIEGVAIVDLPPPGSIEGIDTGVVAIVGEFTDMGFATSVDASGVVTTQVSPVEVFSSADMLNKVGGFDSTLGDFGNADGNGFFALRSKRFSRLVIAPVNLASNVGARFFRQLPLCTSQTEVLPVVPTQGATLLAGREFRNAGGGRVACAKRVNFTAFDSIASDTGGQLVAGASAATQVFSSGSTALKVWQAHTGGTVFVDMTTPFNDATAANFLPFNAVEVVTDFVAFGMADPFTKLTLSNVGGTQGVGGVVAWEYWNGSAWAALTVVDGTTGFTAALTAGQTVTWTAPANWVANTLSAQLAYYVRARVTTVFTTNPAYSQGFVGGTDWSTITRADGGLGALKGDVIVIGYDNLGAIAPIEGGTYRVAADAVAGINLTVERLDGVSFAWAASTNIPWRLQVSSDADSAPVFVVGGLGAGGYAANEAGGFSTPVRPLTNATGGAVDGVYTIGELLVPAVVPPALTGSTADSLSGLQARLHSTVATAFVAATQGINAVNSSTLDAAYGTALDALVSDLTPVADVNIVYSARTSSLIRSLMRQHVLNASTTGLGRMGIIRPELTVVTTDVAVATADPGVGANRTERIVYAWPGARTFIPEAVGIRTRLANGLTTVDGILDAGFDGWEASLMSNLPPERNIGQAAAPVPQVLSAVLGVQTGVNELALNDYITLRARGVAALRMDRSIGGPIVQSGITTSLVAGETNIARRRMADFIQDSIAKRLVLFCKLPAAQGNKDSAVAELNSFMQELLSENNPAARRIHSYLIDDTSGNTLSLEARGIYVIILKVRTLATMDFIALQTEIGEGVITTTAAA